MQEAQIYIFLIQEAATQVCEILITCDVYSGLDDVEKGNAIFKNIQEIKNNLNV